MNPWLSWKMQLTLPCDRPSATVRCSKGIASWATAGNSAADTVRKETSVKMARGANRTADRSGARTGQGMCWNKDRIEGDELKGPPRGDNPAAARKVRSFTLSCESYFINTIFRTSWWAPALIR